MNQWLKRTTNIHFGCYIGQIWGIELKKNYIFYSNPDLLSVAIQNMDWLILLEG